MARWPVEQVEFCLWNDERPCFDRHWQRSEPLVDQGNQWRLALRFGPRQGVRCELIVNGVDRHTIEPHYLSQLASMLRVYGRFWLQHPRSILEQAANAAPAIPALPAPDDLPNEPRRAA